MKSNTSKYLGAIMAASMLVIAGAKADETVKSTKTTETTTTESRGTITTFDPSGTSFIIKSEVESSPTTYTWSKTTTYVDEAGAPVSMEVVKSGIPVTVHYVKEGDKIVANRVVVHTKSGDGGTTTTTKKTEKTEVKKD